MARVERSGITPIPVRVDQPDASNSSLPTAIGDLRVPRRVVLAAGAAAALWIAGCDSRQRTATPVPRPTETITPDAYNLTRGADGRWVDTRLLAESGQHIAFTFDPAKDNGRLYVYTTLPKDGVYRLYTHEVIPHDRDLDNQAFAATAQTESAKSPLYDIHDGEIDRIFIGFADLENNVNISNTQTPENTSSGSVNTSNQAPSSPDEFPDSYKRMHVYQTIRTGNGLKITHLGTQTVNPEYIHPNPSPD